MMPTNQEKESQLSLKLTKPPYKVCNKPKYYNCTNTRMHKWSLTHTTSLGNAPIMALVWNGKILWLKPSNHVQN